MSEKKNSESKTIHMTGTGTCQFIKAEKVEGKAEKLPSVNMEVYNGGKMSVGYWGEVVVDVKGMIVNANTPILYGHNDYDSAAILGQTLSIDITDKIIAKGVIMGKSDIVRDVIELAKNGFNFEVSMGTDPILVKNIQKDESVDVNGQIIDGPFTLVVKSKLREVSILPFGADETTSAAIAAAHNNEVTKMATEKDTKDLAAEQIKAEAKKVEKERVAGITAAAKDYPEIMAEAVNKDWDIEKTKNAILAAENKDLKEKIEAAEKKEKEKQVGAERPKSPHIRNDKVIAQAQDVNSITAAACLNLGISNPKNHFKDEELNAGSDIKVRTFTEMAKACLAKSGKTLDASRHDTGEFLKAAFSTRDIANVISNVQNKFVNEGYGQTEQAWREVSSVRSVTDFKSNTGVRLIMSNLLQSLAPDGEIQHGELSDSTRTIQADTKALMLAITRKDIINDDLGVLMDTPKKLGFAAGRTINTDFWAALEAAVSANFTEANGNYTTGALTGTTLGNAEALFLALTDDDGNPIGVKATKLLCGSTAYKPARELFISTNQVGGSSKSADGNIYYNMFQPIFSSYLSAKPWYLVGNPLGVPLMEVAFLNGNQTPVIESADADFNTLGIKTRCYYDYGVAFAEKKAAVYSTGE